MILAAVVMYKAPKKDRSVTEGMTYCDVDVTSRAQYTAIKNQLLEDLESIKLDLVSRKCLAYAYFCTILTYRADTSGHLVKHKCPPYHTSFKALED